MNTDHRSPKADSAVSVDCVGVEPTLTAAQSLPMPGTSLYGAPKGT